jgi:protein ImuB
MAERLFAEPLVAEDAILETLRGLAQSLGSLLAERGEGARRLEALFFRADGKVRTIAVETGAPTRNGDVIVRLFRERLDALADPLDAGFGFDLIRLCAERAERCETGMAAFAAEANGEKEIAFLVDRLAARFGSHRVLVFQPNDTHIPEAAAVALPAQRAEKSKRAWKAIRGPGEAPRRPLRLFAKPEPIETMSEFPEAPPVRFRWRRAWHEVMLAEGPERIAMEWWRDQSPQPTRDYFRVEDSNGRRFWLYRDGLYTNETAHPRWFMHGLFA